MKVTFTATLCAALVLSVAATAWSHDLVVPPWRGQDGSTFQEWTFDTDASPAAPNISTNAYGTASATTTVGLFGSGWLEQLPAMGTQTGYWDLGGEGGQMALDIPNRPLALPYKEIWIQVTYYRDINQAPQVSVPGAQFVSAQTLPLEIVPTGGAWMVDQSVWRIEPNPFSEQVIMSSDPMWGAVIDQVVVDTICAPEPASVLLLGLAGAFMLRGRRRA